MSIHTEAYLAELSQRHQTFHDADEKEKASLAKSVLEAVIKSDWDTVDNWVGESMKTQKISSADGVGKRPENVPPAKSSRPGPSTRSQFERVGSDGNTS